MDRVVDLRPAAPLVGRIVRVEPIEERHRESYRSACTFLKKVRDLYRRLGEDGAWASYVAGLRRRHGSLRALLDEMQKARL